MALEGLAHTLQLYRIPACRQAAPDGVDHGQGVEVAYSLHNVNLMEIKHAYVIEIEIQLDSEFRGKVVVAPLHDHAPHLAH